MMNGIKMDTLNNVTSVTTMNHEICFRSNVFYINKIINIKLKKMIDL